MPFDLQLLVVALALLARGCCTVSMDVGIDGPTADDKQHLNPLPWDGKPCSNGACKPSFLIIGAGKSGTSSLYYYLQDHPQVEPARDKQIQFFDHQTRRGISWYLSNFPKSLKEGHVTGEASPG